MASLRQDYPGGKRWRARTRMPYGEVFIGTFHTETEADDAVAQFLAHRCGGKCLARSNFHRQCKEASEHKLAGAADSVRAEADLSEVQGQADHARSRLGPLATDLRRVRGSVPTEEEVDTEEVA